MPIYDLSEGSKDVRDQSIHRLELDSPQTIDSLHPLLLVYQVYLTLEVVGRLYPCLIGCRDSFVVGAG